MKIIGSFAVLAIVALAAYNVYFNNEKEQLSALALANIEALASGENSNQNMENIGYWYLCGEYSDQSCVSVYYSSSCSSPC